NLPGDRRTTETRFAVCPTASAPSASIRAAAPLGCLNLTRIVGAPAAWAVGAQTSARITGARRRRTESSMVCGDAQLRHRQPDRPASPPNGGGLLVWQSAGVRP